MFRSSHRLHDFLIQIVFDFIILTISLTLSLFNSRHDTEPFVLMHGHEANFQICKKKIQRILTHSVQNIHMTIFIVLASTLEGKLSYEVMLVHGHIPLKVSKLYDDEEDG